MDLRLIFAALVIAAPAFAQDATTTAKYQACQSQPVDSHGWPTTDVCQAAFTAYFTAQQAAISSFLTAPKPVAPNAAARATAAGVSQ